MVTHRYLKGKNRSSEKIFKGEITLLSLSQHPIDLGLRQLSAILKENSYNVNKIFLRQRMEEDISLKIVEQINEIAKNSLFIGISIMTDQIILAKKLAQKLKQLNKDVTLVGGGVHPTLRPNEILDTFDIVVRGEAEQTILKLADEMVMGNRSDNIKLSTINSKYYNSNEIGFVEDIDNLPYPDFTDNFILTRGRIHLEKEYKYLFGDFYYILTSRGCPYACTYCCNNFYLRNTTNNFFRKRSVSKIIDELKFAKERYKIKQIAIPSDNFLAVSDDEFDDFILQYKTEINLPFTCCASPNLINEGRINKLIKIGLSHVQFGIQSGSESILKLYKRNFYSLQKIIEAGRILNKFHPNLTYAFDLILDNPYETKEDIKKTISLLKEIPRTYNLTLYSLTFYPGTELYNKAVKDGLVKDAYYLKESKYYHKLNNSFYNSIILLYALHTSPRLIAYFMKWESSKNIMGRVCRAIFENSTNILSGLWLFGRIFLSIRNKNKRMVFHYMKLGFSVIKKETRKRLARCPTFFNR